MVNKIMLIDDDKSTNFYHTFILEEWGMVNEINVCQSVDEAIKNLKSFFLSPDLIFLDINMLVKNAWDFLEEYKLLPDHLKAKQLVILSTTKMPFDIERANNDIAVDKFFTKPMKIEMVEMLVASAPAVQYKTN